MVLREEDVRRIVDYAKPWLRDLFAERFADMQWTMLFGFTIVTVVVTVFGLR